MAVVPKLKLKGIHQVGLVVKDIDRAVEAYWRNLGIGPWRLYTYGPPLLKDTLYRGRPENFHMRIALTEVGGTVLELIQHLDGDTLYKEFVERAGEGIHHLGIIVENLAEAVKEAEDAGFRVIMSGRGHGLRGDGGFAYLDTEEELATIIELIEIPSARIQPERIYPPAE